MATVTMITGSILIIIGFYAILVKDNLIKMIIGFSLANTGLHIIMVSLGFLKNRTAPILDTLKTGIHPLNSVTDPVPQALVLTAIVIGFAVTALLLIVADKLHGKFKTLSLRKMTESQ